MQNYSNHFLHPVYSLQKYMTICSAILQLRKFCNWVIISIFDVAECVCTMETTISDITWRSFQSGSQGTLLTFRQMNTLYSYTPAHTHHTYFSYLNYSTMYDNYIRYERTFHKRKQKVFPFRSPVFWANTILLSWKM